jgi:hypothetical protein
MEKIFFKYLKIFLLVLTFLHLNIACQKSNQIGKKYVSFKGYLDIIGYSYLVEMAILENMDNYPNQLNYEMSKKIGNVIIENLNNVEIEKVKSEKEIELQSKAKMCTVPLEAIFNEGIKDSHINRELIEEMRDSKFVPCTNVLLQFIKENWGK